MIVSINQPAYLPWLGYFDRIAVSDCHVVLDSVQFEKNSFVNRNQVRTAQGSTWLTVPVSTKGKFGSLPIKDLEIATGEHWAGKHQRTLSQAYARAPHFARHREFFDDVYSRTWTRLADLIEPITRYLCSCFRITTPMVSSSTLTAEGRKDELVLQICRELGATTYLSGPLGRNYLDESKFARAGIAVRFADYIHPTYPQAHDGFLPNMAAVDLLFMVGEDAGRVLRTTDKASWKP